ARVGAALFTDGDEVEQHEVGGRLVVKLATRGTVDVVVEPLSQLFPVRAEKEPVHPGLVVGVGQAPHLLAASLDVPGSRSANHGAPLARRERPALPGTGGAAPPAAPAGPVGPPPGPPPGPRRPPPRAGRASPVHVPARRGAGTGRA